MNKNLESDLIIDEDRMQLEEQYRQRRLEQAKMNRRKRRKKNDQRFQDMMNQTFYQCSYATVCFSDPQTNPFDLIQWVRDLQAIRSSNLVQITTASRTKVVPYTDVKTVPDPIRIPRHYSAEFKVHLHIRNLAKGKASPEKQATALEYGITLKEGQTWVRDFFKGTGSKDQQ